MAAPDPQTQFLARLSTSLADGTFVRLVLSHAEPTLDGPRRVTGRCIDLKDGPHLSLTSSFATRDETNNLPLIEAVAWVQQRLAGGFRSALLCTTRRDWQWSHPEGRDPRLVAHPASVKAAPSRAHDRARQSWLDASARDWLHALDLCDAQGRIRASMADKHRQIHRYLEILGHLARDCNWPAEQALTFADMGCGKGYLTFGAWHLFRRRLKRNVRVLGVEARPDLVAQAQDAARQIGAEGLEFLAGTIASVELPAMDALIALHACDTATDDALRRGIEAGARLIIVAPCCHKEIRPQLVPPPLLEPVLRHGLMAGRMAEWVTDGLRALFLEWAGYRPKLLEFVASEHTPKNLMIAAVKHGPAFADEGIKARLLALKACFGIARHALDPLLAGAAH